MIVNVNLGESSYPIHIQAGQLKMLPQLVRDFFDDEGLFVITDQNVADLYEQKLKNLLEQTGYRYHLLTVPAGESSKSFAVVNELYTQLIENNASRKSAVLAFGGGVVGDLAGFVAATFMRGIRFAQIPTTILSQVDSSVGGKVGVNHALGKNLIGAFYQPVFVLIDPDVLETLDPRERYAGLAEVVKYGLIQDRGFYELLRENLSAIQSLQDKDLLEKVLATCCRIKADVVQQDEKEGGWRAVLNFGHTIGHALEAVTGYETLLHGEAVMFGMRGAVYLSMAGGHISKKTAQESLLLVDKMIPAVSLKDITVNDVLNAMQHDKKRSQAGQLWVLLQNIGQVFLSRDVDARHVADAIRYVLEQQTL
ncbi:3-dehydroquinate synthase [candidate division KSB1 bacterium]|nr:3-dehydroquinate synthase [candidate division KSB1 bacterium]